VNTVVDREQLSIEDVRRRMDDYLTTIHVLQSFISVVTWDKGTERRIPGSRDSLGRRMNTSARNVIQPIGEVTPDAVIQRNPRLGYVVEAKKSLPTNVDVDRDRWRGVVDQLRKYDDDLVGWWIESDEIDGSCVVLLMDIARTADFSRHLQMLERQEGLVFENPTSLIEFTRAREVKEFVFLRKYWGTIADKSVSRQLESGTKVPLEEVLVSYVEKQFYDSRPLCEHTMVSLWQHVFNEMKATADYDEEERAWVLDVNVMHLTSELQSLSGSTGDQPREVAFPRTDWIREAMEAYALLGLARRVGEGQDFQVFFRRIRGDIIERFAKHRSHLKQTGKGLGKQLPLFGVGEENGQAGADANG